MFRRLAERLKKRRLESRDFQINLDWFRFSVLARVHADRSLDVDKVGSQVWRERPAVQQAFAHDYYMKELQRILRATYEQTNGRGMLDVYPPALAQMRLPDAPSGEATLNRNNIRSDFERRLPHPDNFEMIIRRSAINHEAAGYGVFAGAPVRAGQLIALYPGMVYAPPELSESVVRDNEYCISFSSGWVLDGREWHRRGERFEERLASVIASGVAAPESEAALLKYRNPIGIANYFNHVPPHGRPNAMCCELEVEQDEFPADLVDMVPVDVAPPSGVLSRYVWHQFDGGTRLRMLAAVATRDIAPGEEIYLNYRFNPAHEHPDWYWDPDPAASKRRWSKPKALF